MASTFTYHTVILGAGAAGLMCAAHAGTGTLLIDHAKNPGEKIRISGGGRCNFTNLHTSPQSFISENPHFSKSALSRYSQADFIALVERNKIAYHEKTLGQLFCDHSATDIIRLLVTEAQKAGTDLSLETTIRGITKSDTGFSLTIERQGSRKAITCRNLVVACGGKSIPKMGATGFGYEIAEKFAHGITKTRPALVPLTFAPDILETTNALSGVSVNASVSCGKTRFDEAILFTHRGLSGPAILQISSYWHEKKSITINLLPSINIFNHLREQRQKSGKSLMHSALVNILPKRLAADKIRTSGLKGTLADQSDKALTTLADTLHYWEVFPVGTEGYRTAEVTLGGVSTHGLNSRTMESKNIPGLYFIGEVVDVTGWLGGYNFQWAWSSGFAAGSAIFENRRQRGVL